MGRRTLGVVLALLLLVPAVAHAVPIGVVSFDVLTPGPGGFNTFSITNLTGPFALPGAFPAITPATLGDAQLRVDTATSTMTFDLGDIGPGPFVDLSSLLVFDDAAQFTGARLTARLQPLVLDIDGGGSFKASRSVSAVIVPSAGGDLTPGFDFAVIDAAPSTAPEPQTLTLLGTAAAGVWAALRQRRRR